MNGTTVYRPLYSMGPYASRVISYPSSSSHPVVPYRLGAVECVAEQGQVKRARVQVAPALRREHARGGEVVREVGRLRAFGHSGKEQNSAWSSGWCVQTVARKFESQGGCVNSLSPGLEVRLLCIFHQIFAHTEPPRGSWWHTGGARIRTPSRGV